MGGGAANARPLFTADPAGEFHHFDLLRVARIARDISCAESGIDRHRPMLPPQPLDLRRDGRERLPFAVQTPDQPHRPAVHAPKHRE